MTVIDKDTGWAAFGEAVHGLSDNPHVKVGVQGAEAGAQHGADGLTNVELATYHEYGLGVPKRSFLRDAIDEHQREIADMLFKQGRRVLLGEVTEAYALALVGEITVGIIKERILAHIDPALQPATIAAKGGITTPLFEHGTLTASITYKLGTES